MKKLLLGAAAAAAGLASLNPATAQAALGPEASACRPDAGESAILVHVRGFRQARGNLRVQVHGANGSTWLGNKTHLKRIELPVTGSVMPVCVRVPGPGRYAVAVRHDLDGDRRFTRSDGGGFSGNPRLSITSLRPRYEQSAFTVGDGSVRRVDVVLNYLVGLSIRPVA